MELDIGAGMLESDAEVARITSRIKGFFDDSVAKGEGRYYLARLGSQLGSDRITLETLTGTKLVSFVQKQLGYKIEWEGTHDNIVVVNLGDIAEGAQVHNTAVPRFSSRFWAAFRVPMAGEETRRFINLRTMSFAPERDEVANREDEVREIDPKFIAKGNGPAAPSIIAEHIAAWLAEQKLNSNPFLVPKNDIRREGRSLLDGIIAALTGEQLKRVNLPLDVVNALKKQVG